MSCVIHVIHILYIYLLYRYFSYLFIEYEYFFNFLHIHDILDAYSVIIRWFHAVRCCKTSPVLGYP